MIGNPEAEVTFYTKFAVPLIGKRQISPRSRKGNPPLFLNPAPPPIFLTEKALPFTPFQ